MPRLFSYCIPVDDAAAPNPFWGYCTLAICKPGHWRVAQVGDWVIGTGSCSPLFRPVAGANRSRVVRKSPRSFDVPGMQALRGIWLRRFLRIRHPLAGACGPAAWSWIARTSPEGVSTSTMV